MCKISFNLGLWRGAHGRVRNVPLAATIDRAAYAAGFDYGRANARAVRAGAHPGKATHG